MSETLIKVEDLYKKFCQSLKRSMLYGTIDATKSILGIPIDNVDLRKKEFWALQDINFELKRGETLGLIGQNGCGKTTMLRLLNGIFPPDKGKITVKGRIGALIAVGAGFHPQMTGRENIYLNGAILGMPNNELKRKFDEIVDFADIGDFIDAPVATYSSGMTVRLGFAIAINCEPDILLIDEILAVGDASFRGKCYNRIIKLRESGTGTILVTHEVQSMLDFAKNGLLLSNGQSVYYGDIHSCVSKYETLLMNNKIIHENKNKSETSELVEAKTFITDENSSLIKFVQKDQSVIFNLEINSAIELDNCFITFYITSLNGLGLVHIRNDNDGMGALRVKRGKNILKIYINNLHLDVGTYDSSFYLINQNDSKPIMCHFRMAPLVVQGHKICSSIVEINRRWELIN